MIAMKVYWSKQHQLLSIVSQNLSYMLTGFEIQEIGLLSDLDAWLQMAVTFLKNRTMEYIRKATPEDAKRIRY